MHKTLHKKFTEKHVYGHTHIFSYPDDGGMLMQETEILREAAKDLLQPRPQAVANLLKMARAL